MDWRRVLKGALTVVREELPRPGVAHAVATAAVAHSEELARALLGLPPAPPPPPALRPGPPRARTKEGTRRAAPRTAPSSSSSSSPRPVERELIPDAIIEPDGTVIYPRRNPPR
jgi:hypothetical protein